MVRRQLPLDQPGTDRRHDRELSQRPHLEAVHGHSRDPRGDEEAGLQKSAFRFSDQRDRARRLDRERSALRRGRDVASRSRRPTSSRTVRASGSASRRGRDRCWRRRFLLPTIPTPTISFTGSGIRPSSSMRCAWRRLRDLRSKSLSTACESLSNSADRCANWTGGSLFATGASGRRFSRPSCNMCGPTTRSRRSLATRCWLRLASIRMERSISPAGRVPRMTDRRLKSLRSRGGATRDPDLDETLRAAMLELVIGDLDFIRARASERSFDIWEEEFGLSLLYAARAGRGAGSRRRMA